MKQLEKKSGEKNAALQRGGGGVWHFREGGVEELFIPRLGHIPVCLALIPTASCFLPYLHTHWTLELPSHCLIQTSVTKAPPGLKKTKEEKSIKHVSFSLNPSPVKNSQKRVEEIWNNTQTFFICLKAPTLDGVHIHSLWKPLGGNSTYFCPTGNVERLETFLAGQQAIKDPTDHTLQFTDMNQAATGYTSAAAEVTELSRELCLRFHNQTEVQLCPVST